MSDLIPITPQIRKALKAHHNRTGVSPRALLQKQGDVPDSLILPEFLRWFDSYGPPTVTEKKNLDYVLRCWEKEPDTKKRNRKEQRISLKPADILLLQTQRTRTGCNAVELLKRVAPPEGLNECVVRDILSGRVKQVFPKYLEYLKRAYKAQPDYRDSDFPHKRWIFQVENQQ